MKILVINGPNINMLGIREPKIYGTESYNSLVERIKMYGINEKIDIECFQSNHEGEIVDKIQQSFGFCDGIVINPAAYSHTSIAIHDALKCVNIPVVEVHISNPDERDEFRKTDYVSLVCKKVIKGHGVNGYFEALDFLRSKINES